MTLLVLLPWALPGLILVTVPMLVLYLLALLGLTSWRRSGDQTWPAAFFAEATGVALNLLLPRPVDAPHVMGLVSTGTFLVGLTALVWVPLGNLIWRGVDRLCPGRA